MLNTSFAEYGKIFSATLKKPADVFAQKPA